MELDEYKRLYADQDTSPGWNAIDEQLNSIYADQEPKHWGTILSHALGGPDPLDGISAYECRDGGRDHLHFCTYGFTSLYYDEEAVGGDFSRFGFELTFRLASELPAAEEPLWTCNLLQNLARYVFESGRWFEEHHWVPANGPIKAEFDTDLVGLAFAKDPKMVPLDTPHGRVEFLQLFGITESELNAIMAKDRSCADVLDEHRQTNPLLITDLSRKNC
jgi:hypothetical protein